MSIAPKDSLYRELRAAIAAGAVELPTAYEFVAQHWQFHLDEREQAEREGRRLSWSKIVAILVSTKRIAEPVSGRTFGDYVFKAKEKARKRVEEAEKVDREAHLEAQVEAQQEAMVQIASVLTGDVAGERDVDPVPGPVAELAPAKPNTVAAQIAALMQQAVAGAVRKQQAGPQEQAWTIPPEKTKDSEFRQAARSLQGFAASPSRFSSLSQTHQAYYAAFWDANKHWFPDLPPEVVKALDALLAEIERAAPAPVVTSVPPAKSTSPAPSAPASTTSTGSPHPLVASFAEVGQKQAKVQGPQLRTIESTDDLTDEVEEDDLPPPPPEDADLENDVEIALPPDSFEETVPPEPSTETIPVAAMPEAIKADTVSEPLPSETKDNEAAATPTAGKPRRIAKLM